ncbi:hypothetical protein [Streptosporangium canum]|uniref:hypothetical protein n=1 Tax=Streptosporangium canum TaxID=324952 RepID=UPI0037A93C51
MNTPTTAAEIIRWEEPKPLRMAAKDLAHIADELRANPGKSAVIAEHPNTPEGRRLTANLISAVKFRRRGFMHSDGTFHVTTRTTRTERADGSKVIRVFVCFNPRG